MSVKNMTVQKYNTMYKRSMSNEDELGIIQLNNYIADGRPHVLLDLDSTVISSLSMDKELKHMSPEYQSKFKYHDMPKLYRIFERPFLQVFLDYIFENFNVSVFTAADKDYALFICDNILTKNDPGRPLKYIFHGYHSGVSEGIYNSPKDLKLLWEFFKIPEMNKYNTIIIDDLPDVYNANPLNTIRAPAFELINGDTYRVDTSLANDNWLLMAIPLLEYRKSKIMNRSPIFL